MSAKLGRAAAAWVVVSGVTVIGQLSSNPPPHTTLRLRLKTIERSLRVAGRPIAEYRPPLGREQKGAQHETRRHRNGTGGGIDALGGGRRGPDLSGAAGDADRALASRRLDRCESACARLRHRKTPRAVDRGGEPARRFRHPE